MMVCKGGRKGHDVGTVQTVVNHVVEERRKEVNSELTKRTFVGVWLMPSAMYSLYGYYQDEAITWKRSARRQHF
jgi:hypothetical protein